MPFSLVVENGKIICVFKFYLTSLHDKNDGNLLIAIQKYLKIDTQIKLF